MKAAVFALRALVLTLLLIIVFMIAISNIAHFACYRVERSGVTLVRSHIEDQHYN